MNTKNFISRTLPSTLAAFALLGGVSLASAQTTTDAPKARQEVKEEAKDARATGMGVGGEKSTPNQAKGGTGTGASTGMAPAPKPMKPMSAASRADVKAEAAMANKAGTNPKGESSTKDQDKGGVKGMKP